MWQRGNCKAKFPKPILMEGPYSSTEVFKGCVNSELVNKCLPTLIIIHLCPFQSKDVSILDNLYLHYRHKT